MEFGYQRGKIQDESMLYEQRKHDGSLPIIGVNTFRNPNGSEVPDTLELARATEDEKQGQLTRLRDFQNRTAEERPAVLDRLRRRPSKAATASRSSWTPSAAARWARSPRPSSR